MTEIDEFTKCPICAERINVGDLCASDIEMGTCHFPCLDGSPVVDLETGELMPDGEAVGWLVHNNSGKFFFDTKEDARSEAERTGHCAVPVYLKAGAR